MCAKNRVSIGVRDTEQNTIHNNVFATESFGTFACPQIVLNKNNGHIKVHWPYPYIESEIRVVHVQPQPRNVQNLGAQIYWNC